MKIIRPVAVTDAILTSSDVPENDYAAYNGGTAYALGDHVISTTTHRIYESLQGANTGNPLPVSPATETAWWQDVGATNRWKMFDGGVSTQTEQADGIEVSMSAGRIDAVALLNMAGSTYRVTLVDNDESPPETIYDSGVVSIETASIGDWYQYFYEPIVQVGDVTFTDIPPTTDSTLTVEILAPGSTAKLGAMIIGLAREIGEMQWKPRVGIVDYSRKTTDEFGNTTITLRAFAKRISADVFITNALIDEVIRLLSQYRATALVWVGSPEFTSTIVYGFYKSFDAVIDSPAGSFYNIDIEGLT